MRPPSPSSRASPDPCRSNDNDYDGDDNDDNDDGRYLRVTRQQPRHTMDTILSHLATTIMYDMSPRAFLEKYLVTSPVLQVPAVTMLNGH